MAVKYRLFQEQRKTSPNKGKWYARAVVDDVVGLKTKGADTVKDFSPATNIVGARLNFQPETHWNAADRTRRKAFIQGIEVKMVGEKKPTGAESGEGGETP